jgi:hypothetical protein
VIGQEVQNKWVDVLLQAVQLQTLRIMQEIIEIRYKISEPTCMGQAFHQVLGHDMVLQDA